MTDPDQPDETALLDDLVLAARTDRKAFGRLFDQFHPAVFAYCLRRLLVRAVAEDVTSEVFLQVAAHIADFTGVCLEDFRRWLFRIATNQINAQLRQSIRRRELLEAAVQMGAVGAAVCTPLLADKPARWEEVYQALGEMAQREQSIISLKFFAGLKHEQIAAVLEMKPGAVRVALSRALEKLRERLLESDAPSQSPTGGGN